MATNRDAIGAQVRLAIAGKTMMRQVEAGSGFSAEGMLPVHFGVGNATRIEAVEITWPSGLVQKFDSAQAREWLNSYVDIKESTPQAISVRPYAVAAKFCYRGSSGPALPSRLSALRCSNIGHIYETSRTQVDHAGMALSLKRGFGNIDAIGWKLLAVRAEVRRWETKFLSEIIAARHRSQNRIFTTQHRCCFREVSGFNGSANCRAADDFAVYLHRFHADDVEAVDFAELL